MSLEQCTCGRVGWCNCHYLQVGRVCMGGCACLPATGSASQAVHAFPPPTSKVALDDSPRCPSSPAGVNMRRMLSLKMGLVKVSVCGAGQGVGEADGRVGGRVVGWLGGTGR